MTYHYHYHLGGLAIISSRNASKKGTDGVSSINTWLEMMPRFNNKLLDLDNWHQALKIESSLNHECRSLLMAFA
jgi:hypothetical protein